MKNISIKPPIILSIALLLLAMFPFPYGYYVLLRLVVCLTAGFLAWCSYSANKNTWAWVMGFIVLFFNPIIPLHFGREVWIVVDIAVAVIFSVFLFKNKKKSNRKNKHNQADSQDEISFGD